MFSCRQLLADDTLYHKLDRELERRETYVDRKKNKIEQLQQQLSHTRKAEKQTDLLLEIGQIYKLLQADSADSYVDRALALARKTNDPIRLNEALILKGDVLMMTGDYIHSEQALQKVDRKTCTPRQHLYYYKMLSRLNNMLGEYSDDRYLAEYHRRLQLYTDSVVMMIPKGNAIAFYWQGEQASFYGRKDEAMQYYKRCLDKSQLSDRIYAGAACAMAMIFKSRKQYHLYEHYLLLATISDQLVGTKENFALQELAEYLAKVKKNYHLSNYYLEFALSDALHYNNRLRLIEISHRFPEVTNRYLQGEHQAKVWLSIGLLLTLLLIGGLLVAVYFIRRQIGIVKRQQNILERKNGQLGELSARLRRSSEQRMQYVGIFIGLCAEYINEMQETSKLVVRKVKARQTDDIMRLLESRKMTEKSASEFFVHFDQNFLQLFPDFIARLNDLLRADSKVQLKQGVLLNNELRITALLVLGVSSTQQIATILRYSPQTVYNYRNTMKNRAISRDTFEHDLAAMYAL